MTGFILCTEVVRGSEGKRLSLFRFRIHTAILDLTKRRQIDAVRIYKWLSYCTFSSARYGFQSSLAATKHEVSGHWDQAPCLTSSSGGV